MSLNKILLAALLCATASTGHAASPSRELVDACLRTGSTSKRVSYVPTEKLSINELREIDDDQGAEKLSTVVKIGRDRFGVWATQSPPAHGLVYNDREMPLAGVTRLDKRREPAELDLAKSVYGIASEGASSYLCVTFNFDGLGASGSFQRIRGLYLVDRSSRSFRAYYTVGAIRKIDE